VTTATIVICSRNRPEALRRCLAALRRVAGNADILVVDNASDGDETRRVAEAAGARCVVEPAVGVNRARNTAARHCDSDVLAYVDDDTIPTADWLPNLLKEFDDERVMAVGGRILPGDGDRVDTSPAAAISRYDCGDERIAVDRNDDRWFELTNFGGLGNGANMAFRRSAWNYGPVFDERIGYGTPVRGHGDHSGFFRVVARGGRGVYAPDAVVFHPVEGSIEEQQAKSRRALEASGAYLMLLFVEYPQYRRLLFRYLRGKRRKERPAAAPPAGSRLTALFALLRGARLYFRVRRAV